MIPDTIRNLSTATAPSHSCPSYVIARVKKLLAAQGWPIAHKSGRYSPFGSTVVVTEGYRVQKVGCSKSVSVCFESEHFHGRSRDLPRETRRAREVEAIELLRSAGYRVDDRGWIECDGYDMRDM